MKNIVFIGMPGAGKTTIGKAVAKALHRPFTDSDDYLQQMIGRDIKALFRESEEKFRYAETSAIRELAAREGIVIACGGGVVKRTENMNLLRKTGTVFFLDRNLQDIARSVDTKGRPLLNSSANRLQQLYDERIDLYRRYSHYTIPVVEGPQKTAQIVLTKIQEIESR
jgi:shikimate kinase